MEPTSQSFPCELPEARRSEQARNWRSLSPLVVRTERTRSGFRMVFERSALVDVEALVVAERSCCGWASWSVRPGPDGVEVEVTGPASEVAALADSFGV